MPSKAKERVNFGKIKEIIAPPNLIAIRFGGAMISLILPKFTRSFALLGIDIVGGMDPVKGRDIFGH